MLLQDEEEEEIDDPLDVDDVQEILQLKPSTENLSASKPLERKITELCIEEVQSESQEENTAEGRYSENTERNSQGEILFVTTEEVSHKK